MDGRIKVIDLKFLHTVVRTNIRRWPSIHIRADQDERK
jgi:hypothetical protein